MKVLVCAPDQIATREGGLRTQVVSTVNAMRDLGIAVDYYNGYELKDYDQYDVIHVFSMNLPTHFKALSLKKFNKPMVYSSVMWRRGNRNVIRLSVEILKKVSRFVKNDLISCYEQSHWANRILPNTEAESNWLHECVGVDKNKCSVVPNGVHDSFSQIRQAENWKEMIDNQAVLELVEQYRNDYILSICVISDRKNLIKLAEAAITLKKKLVIAGPIEDKIIYNKLLALRNEGLNFLHLGPFTQGSNEIGVLLRFCRVFALVSEYETPGIAALEAGLFDKPVVITSVGGTEEYFGDYAYYANPKSVDEIYQALKQALGGPEKIEGLSKHIFNEFSWRRVAEMTISAYKDILQVQANIK